MLIKLTIFLAAIIQFSQHERIITTLKYSKFRVKPTIVNGAIARTGQIPYLVSIKESIGKKSGNKTLWSNLCGGSIIGPAKVLTAAHCFESKNFYYKKHPEKLRVVAGCLKSNLRHSGVTETTDWAQWRKIFLVTTHDDFNFPSNDIAIAFVETPWNYTATVSYIPPAARTIDYRASCFAAGFGQTGRTYVANISNVLLWAEIEVFSRAQCNVIWEMNMDDFICTGSVATDVGGGDSGGPLACFDTLDPTQRPDRQLLVGVVSGKNFDRTTLFTRVSAFRSWIQENAGNSNSGMYVVSLCLIKLIFILLLLVIVQ